MEPLSDPLSDRFEKSLPPPPHHPLERSLLYPNGINYPPDWELLRSHLQYEGRLTKADFMLLIRQGTDCLRRDQNLIELKDPVTVVGDIHGQFYDFLRILELGGNLNNTKYLFLGDYVDRGSFSIEVLQLLYAIKLNYQQTVFLIRGNHECRQMSSYFNFRTECLYKYDTEVYDTIMDSFDALPVACILNNKFLAVHGGISPELASIEDIRKMNRYTEPPRQGMFCDLLWSDPIDNDTGASSDNFVGNDVRGCSFYYGIRAVNTFLKQNKLLSVLRGHEAQLDGYKMHRWNGNSEFPVVITIFSAPNYCDVYNNKAAVVKFENNSMNVQQFNYTEHPYILPNFMDVFTWSTPFVIEKVLEMLRSLIQARHIDELNALGGGDKVKELKEGLRVSKIEQFKNKVKAVTRMMKMFKTLRESQEVIIQLKGLCPDNKVPKGLLQQGRDAIIGAVDSFGRAKQLDMINEKRPD